MRPLEPELEEAAAPLRLALQRLRDAVDDDAVAPIAAHVERAFALASFSVRPAREDPIRAETFGAGVPAWPEGPMFPSLVSARERLEGEPLAAMIDALEEMQKALVFRADCSEYWDALLNRTVYLRAAGRLDCAEPLVLELARRVPG